MTILFVQLNKIYIFITLLRGKHVDADRENLWIHNFINYTENHKP